MGHNFQKIAVASLSALGMAALMACGDDSSSVTSNFSIDSSSSYLDGPGSSDAGLGASSADGATSGLNGALSSGESAVSSSGATMGASSSSTGVSSTGDSANSSANSSDASAQSAGSSANTTSSGASMAASSSSEAAAESSAAGFKFGYALKNAPTPSKGCGKESTLKSDKKVENGEHHVVNVNGDNREYFITLPENYDNSKAHKLLIALHCYGSSAEDFVHHAPDYDHPTPYYGQQVLDKNGDYIFASLQAVGGLWNKGQADHDFFGKALTTIEENYCIDTSRVFITGFSYGAMFSYSLMQDYQERVRAAATYAVADYNIWLPQETGSDKNLPIAWMNVHGKQDDRCTYDKAKGSALPRVLKKNGKASDGDSEFTDASSEVSSMEENQGNTGHTCHNFKTVDERFPVRFCSWPGGHQWTAHDEGNMSVGWNWESTWVPEAVHEFFEQF